MKNTFRAFLGLVLVFHARNENTSVPPANTRVTKIKSNVHLTQISLAGNINEDSLKTKGRVRTRNASYYLEMVQSGLFADKSELIHSIFKNEGLHAVLITCARRWGKSINLDMIALFSQVQRDASGAELPRNETKAWNLFAENRFRVNESQNWIYLKNELQISSRRDTINAYLGKFEVIKLDFSLIYTIGATPLTFETFLEYFQNYISSIYTQFEHLENELKKQARNNDDAADDLKCFLKIKNKELAPSTTSEYFTSITELMILLKRYFGYRSILLVDEYDHFFNHRYFNRDVDHRNPAGKQIQEFYTYFMTLMCKGVPEEIQGVSSRLCYKVILTGISRLIKQCLFSGWNNVIEWSMVDNMDIYPYYGFTSYEIDDLAYYTGLPEEKKSVMKYWYDGYHTYNHLTESLYNPVSVMGFLDSRTPKQYWMETGSSFHSVLYPLIKHFQIRLKLQPLLNVNTSCRIHASNVKPSFDNIEKIAVIIRELDDIWRTILADDILETAISFLFSFGYLSLHTTQSTDYKYLNLAIPNEEIRMEFHKRFEEYYSSLKHHQLLQETADIIYIFLENNAARSLPFNNAIKKLLQNIGELENFEEDLNLNDERAIYFLERLGFCHPNEAAVHFTLFKVLSLLQISGNVSMGAEVPFKVNANYVKCEYRIDLVARSKNHLLIIETKYNDIKGAQNALIQAQNYARILKDKSIKFNLVKFVGVNLRQNGQVDIETSLMTANQIDEFLTDWTQFEKTAFELFTFNRGYFGEQFYNADENVRMYLKLLTTWKSMDWEAQKKYYKCAKNMQENSHRYNDQNIDSYILDEAEFPHPNQVHGVLIHGIPYKKNECYNSVWRTLKKMFCFHLKDVTLCSRVNYKLSEYPTAYPIQIVFKNEIAKQKFAQHLNYLKINAGMFGGSSAVRVYANDYIPLITLRIFEEALRHWRADKIHIAVMENGRVLVQCQEHGSNSNPTVVTTLRQLYNQCNLTPSSYMIRLIKYKIQEDYQNY